MGDMLAHSVGPIRFESVSAVTATPAGGLAVDEVEAWACERSYRVALDETVRSAKEMELSKRLGQRD